MLRLSWKGPLWPAPSPKKATDTRSSSRVTLDRAAPSARGMFPATTPVAVTKPTSGAEMCMDPPFPLQ